MLETNTRYDREEIAKKGIIKGDNNEVRINKWFYHFLNLLGGANMDETDTC